MYYKTIFFDLDDTLYPSSSGLWEQIKSRIGLYMLERLKIPEDQVQRLRREYFAEYGTTLRGLQTNYGVDRSDYLQFVHDLPLADYIGPDPKQREVIQSLPARKVIFTNADANHARRVLNVLQLEDCFDAIVDILAIDPYCKPMAPAFKIAMSVAGVQDPKRCVLIDDLARSTQVARELGMFSILYGRDDPGGDADAAIRDWADLPTLIGEN